MLRSPHIFGSWTTACVASLALLSTLSSFAQAQTYISGTNAAGVTSLLATDRFPALYTGDYGDCLPGGSLLNVTLFDAAYYADNMTVLFHLAGMTNIRKESVMMIITVNAYGENRFSKIFNPCSTNINSLCPMNATVPIRAEAIIPVGIPDVADIPDIALVIPDFEGYATLRIYANSTETEIGCFQAVMRNGATMSHPAPVGSVLGVFTVVALIASFATAIYGVSIPAMRTHHAHSLSVLVVFETFQYIFFSGALSLNWPSVCAAFWSNYAWSAGMIYSPQMTNSINKFLGVNLGNSSQTGSAGSAPLNNNGGLQQIYGRTLSSSLFSEHFNAQDLPRRILNRATDSTDVNSTVGVGYSWYGKVASQGLPAPGNWSGFGGELSEVNIPASNAFMTGFLWFLILLAILIGATVAFKWFLEGLSLAKWIQQDRLALFRTHWLGFLGVIVLQTMFISFFMMTTLALFQFSTGASVGASAGVTAIASIVFLIFFVGMLGVAGYACFYRLRFGHYESSPDRIRLQTKKIMKVVPWPRVVRESSLEEAERVSQAHVGSLPFFRVRYIDNDAERQTVHQDQTYTKRFGWLSSHFRRTRWWFFAVWIVYQFVRACFIGGANAHPTAQVFGLFAVEIIALIGVIWINPFEGARNTSLAVYMLGISKVATAGLSAAFLPQYNLARIPTTVVGFVIIIIQGFLTIAVLILIALSAISSYMSLTRNREEIRPHGLEGIRLRYFTHLETKAPDVPPPPPPPPTEPEEPKEPYFSVNTVRRAPKIEDEDTDLVGEMAAPPEVLSAQGRNSRSNSMRSNYSGFGNAPYGARVHRMSWSSRDFANWQQEGGLDGVGTPQRSQSRQAIENYTNHSASNSQSAQPLVHPKASLSSLRPSTPTKEKLKAHADERIGNTRE